LCGAAKSWIFKSWIFGMPWNMPGALRGCVMGALATSHGLGACHRRRPARRQGTASHCATAARCGPRTRSCEKLQGLDRLLQGQTPGACTTRNTCGWATASAVAP
jgi:hypothetical protein